MFSEVDMHFVERERSYCDSGVSAVVKDENVGVDVSVYYDDVEWGFFSKRAGAKEVWFSTKEEMIDFIVNLYPEHKDQWENLGWI